MLHTHRKNHFVGAYLSLLIYIQGTADKTLQYPTHKTKVPMQMSQRIANYIRVCKKCPMTHRSTQVSFFVFKKETCTLIKKTKWVVSIIITPTKQVFRFGYDIQRITYLKAIHSSVLCPSSVLFRIHPFLQPF